MALEPSQSEKTVQPEITLPVKTFPGLNEVVPQATLVAAKINEGNIQVLQAETRDTVYQILTAIAERLQGLEEHFNNWQEINRWQLSRLRSAQYSYTDLGSEQKVQLDIIYSQLRTLEELRSTWEKEKVYWQEWQEFLSKTNVKAAEESFQRTLSSIDNLLKKVNKVGEELVKAQQKYSPGQEIIDSRLSIINKTLGSLRMDVFHRNTYSIFEPGFYRQFNRELFVDFSNSLTTNLRLPLSYLTRHILIFVLLGACTLIITLLLIYLRRQQKPVKEELRILFERPISGATLLSFYAVGILSRDLFSYIPDGWRWMLIISITVIAIRLINVLYKDPLEKKIFSIIAVLSIIEQTLLYLDFPSTFLQLYHGILCAALIPFFWQLISRRRSEMSATLHTLIYLLLGLTIVGLISTMLGYERFSTKLIAATFFTIIFFILVKTILRLADGGIEAFMQMEWISKRKFIQVLGLKEWTGKLKNLLKIIILLNAFLSLLVIWMVFDNTAEALEAILNYQYKFGEFTFSVKMVVLVIIVLYLTTLFSWVVQAFVDSQIMTPQKMERGIKESLKRLIHYGLFTIGFFIAVSTTGLDLQKFTILAGALGVGIGFGLQNIVNNFVSGLILLFERPVKVGDIISIGEDWGTITRIGLRSTVFETFDRSEIIVPNGDLIAQKVTNWTFSSKIVRVSLPVGVAYGSPLEKVLEILNEAAAEHSEVLTYPKPDPVFEGFGTSSIDFKLRFWVHSIDQRLRIRTEVAVIIDRLFREADIVIAFPQQDLHLRSIDSDLHKLFGAKVSKEKSDKEEKID
jgi:small-conductance mechanosensitive channel